MLATMQAPQISSDCGFTLARKSCPDSLSVVPLSANCSQGHDVLKDELIDSVKAAGVAAFTGASWLNISFG